ncbi:MAG: flavodoxin family protein [Armatimonadetes bacterium CG_4_10_14_3_um_filter_66_18]|nr:flavodoxin family protein [Armatimonadota bacterium]NDK12130.1 flavodoxin family protein [Armatimonadota bacterium]PIY48124.1 MAG: flavodoxin family protein [Armatimonadetes bacterium CG_4_10_14_3_um_filter_66_18]
MKVLAVCGSPRRNGNTEGLLRIALEEIEKQGIETELLLLAGRNVKPCVGCYGCLQRKDGTCTQKDPEFDELAAKFHSIDGLILGSPVYFGSATAQINALMDRVAFLNRAGGPNHLSRTAGASVAVARRAGENFTFAQLNYYFGILDMFTVGSTYWNIAIARQAGEFEKDDEGVATVRRMAENMGWLIHKLRD